MSSTSLSTTGYAMLGMLAIRPWRAYELARQMTRGVGRMWPRAESKIYEVPKQLVAIGFARATTEANGRRTRTIYTITAKGRRALAAWLREPGSGPSLEFEQLLKIFFAESGTRTDALNTLAGTAGWARARSAESLEIGRQYVTGAGPFPERMAELNLVARFMTDFYLLVGDWAEWASGVVEAWPEEPRKATVARTDLEEIVRRAARGAGESGASKVSRGADGTSTRSRSSATPEGTSPAQGARVRSSRSRREPVL